MTYQVMARRWRPRSLKEVVGHEWVVKALSYALVHRQIHQAYLFTGTRGIGKTTFARILARCLNCEQGPTDEPCGTCVHCVAMNNGTSLDLIEVDAASKTKVEETRALLENVYYSPAQSRYKIYLIDEVHMLSAHSFNALLKTLEEPPAHVCFILATTELEKVPETVRSRCLPFRLKPMSASQIAGYLKFKFTQEQIPFEEAALLPLARAGCGSVRDTLTLLEQILAYGEGTLRADATQYLLGLSQPQTLQDLLDHLLKREVSSLAQLLQIQWETGVDPERLLLDFLTLLKDLTWLQLDPDGTGLFQWREDLPELKAKAKRLTAMQLQMWYEIGIRGKLEMDAHPDPQSALEMILLRMMAFKPLTGMIQSPHADAAEPSPVCETLERSTETVKPTAVSPIPPLVPPPEPTQPTVAATPWDWAAFCLEHLCVRSGGLLSSFEQNILLHTVCLKKEKGVLELGVVERGKALFNLASGEHAAMAKRVLNAFNQVASESIESFDWAVLGSTAHPEQETPFQRQERLKFEKNAQAQAVLLEDPSILELQSAFGDLEITLKDPH